MSTIDSTTATPTPTASSSALAKNNSDYNMFLKLLTTQMTNQDPLDPMDTSEYTSQLVQYSEVEQSIQQTDTLNSILAQLSTQNVTQATGLIGKTAEFDSKVAGLTETADASWRYTAERAVTSLTATVTDASGRKVATFAVDPPATSGSVTWDGMLSSGTRAPSGSYTVSLDAKDISGAAVSVATTTTGMISEVTSANGTVTLGVNGVQLSMDKLIKLTTPST